MRSFIPWVGGKSKLAKMIVDLIPEHTTYVEPFMGAAWVFFAKQRSTVEVLNDLNGDLVTLFRVVRDRWEDLYSRRIFLLQSERDYRSFLSRLETREWKDEIERALMFYYCLKQSFGSKVGGGWAFGRTRPPGSLDMDSLGEIHHRLKGVYINDQDVFKCLARWDSEAAYFYLDPPYMMTTRSKGYYQHEMTLEDHRKLWKILVGIKGRWLLSYDDDPTVRKWYRDYPMLTPEIRYNIDNRPGRPPKLVQELLIANYDLVAEMNRRTVHQGDLF